MIISCDNFKTVSCMFFRPCQCYFAHVSSCNFPAKVIYFSSLAYMCILHTRMRSLSQSNNFPTIFRQNALFPSASFSSLMNFLLDKLNSEQTTSLIQHAFTSSLSIFLPPPPPTPLKKKRGQVHTAENYNAKYVFFKTKKNEKA